jgi:hypothetical protein
MQDVLRLVHRGGEAARDVRRPRAISNSGAQQAMTDTRTEGDLIAKLDALAALADAFKAKHPDHYNNLSDEFYFHLGNAWPQLRAELLAAREVCETADRYDQSCTLDRWIPVEQALAAWRAALGGAE